MAQSIVDCCNDALQMVGVPRILSIDDNRKEARQCASAWDGCRRSELRAHRWNFAIKRAVLAPDSTAPTFGFTYQFTLPTDCLRVLRPSDYALDWLIEGRKILTNSGDTLQLRYIADIENPALWDSLFYDLVAVAVAEAICESVTGSTVKLQVLGDRRKSITQEAKRTNAFEQAPVSAPDDFYWVARF